MKHLKKLGLAGTLVLTAAFGLAGTASATTIEPPNTAVVLTSTTSTLAVSGSSIAVSCQHATLSGTTPPLSHTTWATVSNVTLGYSNCSAAGIASATVNQTPACHTTARPSLHAMGVTPATAIATVTLPVGCTIDVSIATLGGPCTLTVTGGQTIGRHSGTGTIDWTNIGGSASARSIAHLNEAFIPDVHSNGLGFGCPSAGTHTGSLTGTYQIAASSPNVTVTP